MIDIMKATLTFSLNAQTHINEDTNIIHPIIRLISY